MYILKIYIVHTKPLVWCVRIVNANEYHSAKAQALECQRQHKRLETQQIAVQRSVIKLAGKLSAHTPLLSPVVISNSSSSNAIYTNSGNSNKYNSSFSNSSASSSNNTSNSPTRSIKYNKNDESNNNNTTNNTTGSNGNSVFYDNPTKFMSLTQKNGTGTAIGSVLHESLVLTDHSEDSR